MTQGWMAWAPSASGRGKFGCAGACAVRSGLVGIWSGDKTRGFDFFGAWKISTREAKVVAARERRERVKCGWNATQPRTNTVAESVTCKVQSVKQTMVAQLSTLGRPSSLNTPNR